jgi:hypothetical protein
MEKTLDECLAEVDRWKRAVGQKMRRLAPAQRAVADREAIAQLEREMGITFRKAPLPSGTIKRLPRPRPRKRATA